MRKTEERPILFNTEMVRAILSGRKTMTRRLVRPTYRPDEGGFQVCTNKKTGERWVEKMDEEEGSFDDPRYVKPPYMVGDILYVRETWAEGYNGYIYKADDMTAKSVITWHPSIHMPKEAARIWLKVTDIGVEQLHDMTVDDVLHEGVSIAQGFKDFITLWDSTVPSSDLDEYGWGANPWVWVIHFERIEKQRRRQLTNEEAIRYMHKIRVAGRKEPNGEETQSIEMAIKALRAVPSLDCIRREDAIKAISEAYDLISAEELLKKLTCAYPERRWIPVEERLPDACTFVNATCESLIDDRDNWVIETVYLPQPPESRYSDWGNIPMLNWGEARVIAWQERIIPDPYMQ